MESTEPNRQEQDNNRTISSSDCMPLPALGETLEKFLASTKGSSLKLQGVGYDHNPPHDFTFSDSLKRHPLNLLWSMAPEEIPGRIFAYFLDSLTTQDDALIPLPRDRFWCLLRPGSELLLSDGRTQHYTMVYDVDRVTETLDIADSWPEAIFLRSGLNLLGIEAKIIEVPDNGKLVRITRAEFERVIVGAISVESPMFHEHFLKVFPSGRDEPRLMLALAITIFGQAGQENPLVALPYFNRAFELALRGQGEMLQRRIAGRLLFARVFVSYWLRKQNIDQMLGEQGLADLQQATRLLQLNFPELSINNALTEEELIRLGQIAWSTHYAADAETFFTSVIEQSPENPEGYFGRSKARNKLLDHEGTIADSTQSIELINLKLRSGQIPLSLEENKDGYKLLDFFAAAPERRKLEFMLVESYFLRGNAHNVLNHYADAETDGRMVIELNPSRFDGYLVVAASLNLRRRYPQAVLFYEAARRCTTDPQLQRSLDAMIQSMIGKAKELYPDVRIGFVQLPGAPSVFIFRHAEAVVDFVERFEAGKDTEMLKPTFVGIVPAGSRALAYGEDSAGNIQIEIDMILAGGTWSPDANEKDSQGWKCHGIVPKFAFYSLPSQVQENR